MKRINYLFIASVVLLSACAGGFKKGDNNIEYKIIKGSGGKKLEPGSIMEITFKNQIKDTVFGSSDESGRQILMLDSTQVPKMYFNIFRQASVGDSIVIRMLADTFFHKNYPPFAKKGEMVYSTFRVTNYYPTKESADSAFQLLQKHTQEMQMAKYLEQARKDSIDAIPQLKADSKHIEEYLAKNNITALKGKLGTYVQVIAPGIGPLLDTGMVIKINYTGRTLDGGTVFDSNTIDSFKHVESFTVEIPENIAMARVVKGWIDGLRLLQKGSKAKFYIPSTLGWGKLGSGEKIPPNTNVVFDIEVVDVQSAQAAMNESIQKQKEMMEAQSKAQQKPATQTPKK
ncbi:MAG: FKBP-type peptidyl-prolyl cis-trans isomerase [Ferruginibacter sp.]